VTWGFRLATARRLTTTRPTLAACCNPLAAADRVIVQQIGGGSARPPTTVRLLSFLPFRRPFSYPTREQSTASDGAQMGRFWAAAAHAVAVYPW